MNVAPNREGLIDKNVIDALREIGKKWDDQAVKIPVLSTYDAPIIMPNLAKQKPSYSSWGNDMWIMDFANDDNFTTNWKSNPQVKVPWYIIDFQKSTAFNTIVITDTQRSFKDYALFYEHSGEWLPLPVEPSDKAVKVHRFNQIWGNRIKIEIKNSIAPTITELGVYNEMR